MQQSEFGHSSDFISCHSICSVEQLCDLGRRIVQSDISVFVPEEHFPGLERYTRGAPAATELVLQVLHTQMW
jgi:hypothetical protein